jgi:hypothetical protein
MSNTTPAAVAPIGARKRLATSFWTSRTFQSSSFGGVKALTDISFNVK